VPGGRSDVCSDAEVTVERVATAGVVESGERMNTIDDLGEVGASSRLSVAMGPAPP
jgi:hypothetical protein